MGGQQRRLASLVAGLGEDFSHRILSLDGETGARTLLGPAFAQVEPFPFAKSSLVSLGNLQRFSRVLRDIRPDVLCTYNWGSLEAAIANRLSIKAPHVHHEDGFGPDEIAGEQKPRRVFARRAILKRSLVTVPSTGLERIAREVWGLDAGRVVRNPVGVDLARFCAPDRRYDRAPVTVVAIGALRAEKNFARLINAFARADEGKRAQLVIYGEGPQRDDLRGRAAQSPAADHISFAGPTATPQTALAGADIFALSSDTEQTPISLIEAMASGLPALAPDVGDIRLMVSAANAAFIPAPGDEDAYVAALAALIEDAALRERLGRANLARSEAFGDSAMIEAFRTLYSRAAGKAG